jgi:hypothetical protein
MKQRAEGLDCQGLLRGLACCGLNCRNCDANMRLDTAILTTDLLEWLGSISIHVQRFWGFLPSLQERLPSRGCCRASYRNRAAAVERAAQEPDAKNL